MKKQIPNFITLLNLTAGFLAIIMIIENRPDVSAFLIFTAAILDFLDGFTARTLKAYSDIGKSLDSLADLVSFGVVPGLIIYSAYNQPALQTGDYIIFLSATIVPVFSAIRLAIFNNDEDQKREFKGLPTPASAILIASLFLTWQGNPDFFIPFTRSALFITSIATAIFLILPLPMFSIKFKNYRFRQNSLRYSYLLISLLLIILFHFEGLFYSIILYILVSVLERLLRKSSIERE